MRNSVTAPLFIVVSSSAGLAQARSQDLSGIWAFGGLQTANASPIYRGSLRDPLGDRQQPVSRKGSSGFWFDLPSARFFGDGGG